MQSKLAALIILDGIGAAHKYPGNAVAQADTSFLGKAWATSPHTYLDASGEDVGLPEGTNGNSEVGHMNLGAGKVVYQSFLRINKSIRNGSFRTNATIQASIENAIKNNTKLHVMGLISDGGTHSHIDHAIEILKIISEVPNKPPVYIHVFTDGRDSDPKAAKTYCDELQHAIQETGTGKIATITGRYFAMDRNLNWDRTQKAYEMMTQAKGKSAQNYSEAIEDAYNDVKSDEFIEPYVLDPDGKIENGDSLIFINFRADRAVQITQAFIDPDFQEFNRTNYPDNLFMCSMMPYQKDIDQYSHLIFPRNTISLPLGRVLSEHGLTQLRIAEAEKYPHVTYFLNGGQNFVYPGENRIKIDSPNVATYDQKPEMSAGEVTRTIIREIRSDRYDFIITNFANGDMVGHTGVLNAGIKAIQVVDQCVEMIVNEILSRDGVVFITADHGNSEEMSNRKTQKMVTEHTTNPVPFIIMKKGLTYRKMPMGRLADVSPTILSQLGYNVPNSMNGRVLI
jgi:2,3-bisphosphoglycerate-independent phosphoglycerate mutase